jgi:hypothetical protein
MTTRFSFPKWMEAEDQAIELARSKTSDLLRFWNAYQQVVLEESF